MTVKHIIMKFSLLLITAAAFPQGIVFNNVKWEKERIARGLILRSVHDRIFDTLIQNINILEVNLRKRNVTLLHDSDTNKTVPLHVRGSEALAAINAGFFNIKNGGSVTYLRVDGRIADSDTAAKWKRNQNMNGVFIVGRNGEVLIGEARTNAWFDARSEYDDILVTGCLMVHKGSVAKLPATSLVITRHPRSAAGLRGRNSLLLVTVDGRTSQASGMTLPELASFFRHLRCRDAVNLDGGGSTTMWVKGKPFDGIVNMPCDNRRFDHEGARAVANVIMIY